MRFDFGGSDTSSEDFLRANVFLRLAKTFLEKVLIRRKGDLDLVEVVDMAVA